MKQLIVGDMYMIKLKQTSKKGFSVRATGSLSKKGLPEKSNKAKVHQELYSRTPIKIGVQENINSTIGVSSDKIAQLHLFHRSSIVGRRYLAEKLATSIKTINDFPDSPDFKNRNVEILQAYLKTMGVKIEFSDENYVIDINTGDLEEFDYDGKIYLCTKIEFEKIKQKIEIEKEFENNGCFVGTVDEYKQAIEDKIKEFEMRETMMYIDI
jgi:hypothetical protein